MKAKFKIDVGGGGPDYEDLVAEIYCGANPMEDFVAIVSQEEGLENAKIEIHPRKDGKPWNFELKEFEEAIQRARHRLWELRRNTADPAKK